MSLGWPIATIFTLTLAASMAELCSAYPTSGAMYHWASALGGPAWGWFTAWLNIVGLIAAQAGINYSCAQFILPFFGFPVSARNVFLVFAFTLIVHGILNHYGVKLVAMLNDLSVTVHLLGVAAIVIAIVWLAPLKPVAFLLTAHNSNGRSPYLWVFLLGLLQAQWTYTGFDASAHMTEETTAPRRTAPWGIVLSVAVSGVAGYALLIALTLAIPSIAGVLSAKDADGNAVPTAIAVFQMALGAKFGNAMAALASMAMWFCGLSCITSASRAVYSLARDKGMPWPSFFSRVNQKHGTPGQAIWSVVAASLVVMVWSGAVPIVTSLSTVALYISYTIPIVFAAKSRLAGADWPAMAHWRLGRYGLTLNVVAISYSAIISVVLLMPPNELSGKTLAGVMVALALIYLIAIRGKFQGPEWTRSAASTSTMDI